MAWLQNAISGTKLKDCVTTHYLEHVKQASPRKLCTETKDDHADSIQIASAFEAGLRCRRTIGQSGKLTKAKEKPVNADTKTNIQECWRCGAGKLWTIRNNQQILWLERLYSKFQFDAE